MILCHNCEKQECQDIILQFNSVICSINTISVSVAILQMKSHYAMMINIILHTSFRNFNPSVNNDGLIKSVILNDDIYATKRKIRFMSSQYSNKITNEPEKKF